MEAEQPRATLKFKTKKGFTVLMTITSKMTTKEIGELCDNVEAAELQADNHGFIAVEERPFTKPTAVQAPLAPPKDLGNCKKCGAPNAFSKAGKIYCSNRCWLTNSNERTY